MRKPILATEGQDHDYALFPLSYPWAWSSYKTMIANFWTPEEIAMGPDMAVWHSSDLTEEERHLFLTVFSQLTTFDLLRTADLSQRLIPLLHAPELVHVLTVQSMQECVHCYAEGTEVLTERGWTDFRDLTDDELVAQYHDDGSADFVKHLGVTIDQVDTHLLRFSNSAVDFVVTEDHKCCYRNANSKATGKLSVAKAKELPLMAFLPVAAHSGADAKLSAIERLQIAFQADGHKPKDKNRKVISFNFAKSRKVERIIALAEEAEIKYRVYRYGKVTRITLWPPRLDIFDKDFSWVSPKYICYGWAREFVEELTHWDGHIATPGNTRIWTSINSYAVDVVQYVAALGGFHARVNKARYNKSGTQQYRMSLVDQTYVSAQSFKREQVPYSGKVYSVGVPSRNLIVRYNGKVLISQNTHSYQHIIETLGLPQDDIYQRYRQLPALNNRVKLAEKFGELSLDDKPGILRALIHFYCLFEGVWFLMNLLGPVQSLARRGLMKCTAEQFQYITRDEQSHVALGLSFIRDFMVEYPDAWTDETKRLVISDTEEALQLEEVFIRYALPRPILGYNADDHILTARHYAERWLGRIGLSCSFGGEHRIPWMDEMVATKKEKNFFETRVTEYQIGTLKFEENEDDGFGSVLR